MRRKKPISTQKFVTIGGNQIATEDLKFFNDAPSRGFSPQRNQAVINGTIEKYKKFYAAKQAAYMEGIRERTDALSYYLKSLAKKDQTPEQYFGKRVLGELQGRKIMSNIFRAANGQKAAKLWEA